MTVDIARRKLHASSSHLTAADVMATNPKSIGRNASIRDTARFFRTHDLHTAAVIDEAGRPLGVVTRTDLLEYWGCRRDQQWSLANGEPAWNSTNAGIYHRVADPTVLRIMTPVVFCVPVDAPIAKVVEMILALEVRCLFVTDEHGVLVGVVSVFDLLRSVASRAGANRHARSRPLKPALSTGRHGREDN